MKHLPLPATAEEDRAVIKLICNKAPWKPVLNTWENCYNAYTAAGGDPWKVSATKFLPKFSKGQKDFYDKRKSGGPIKRIRDTKGLLSCPVCGSETTGSLDHFLPRKEYPEFSIMRANLIPACVHCNSGEKGTTVKGDNPNERFLQPYFDTWADYPLWQVKFNKPFEAATFKPVPDSNLSQAQFQTVRFHINNVLGTQFEKSMSNLWSTLPERIYAEVPNAKLHDCKTIFQRSLTACNIQRGVNGWETAFYRGLLADADAMRFLAAKVAKL